MFNSPAKEANTINLKDGSCEMGESLHDAAHNAGRKVRSMLHSASDELSHARDYVGTEIRSNPVRSSVIALGVGVLLGALLRK
ncbi:MAG: DUF883 C-terminal domain-containing protein [Alphaproteobacteria bacterium]|nr:DUF883 C-terminal domain-containing protein [Alphaproteobacteria bacterium]